MARLILPVIAVFWACATLSSAQGQQPPQQQPPQPGPCTSGLEQQLPTQCFAANGVDYQGVLFILSGNRTGAIPAGSDFNSFRSLLCQTDKQDSIVPCVLRMMQSWNRTTCTDGDRQLMVLRGGQLLAFMEAVCGEACEPAATQNMPQCIAAAQMDPAVFLNPNGTLFTDRFPLLGDNARSAQTFCSVRQQMFSCLNSVNAGCPSFAKRLYALGLDVQAMDRATQLLCNDVNQYLQGLQCFANPTAANMQCLAQSDSAVAEVLNGRYVSGTIPPSMFLPRLCKLKLSLVDCQERAYAQSCPTLATLRKTFDCTVLPVTCKEDPNVKAEYDALCSKNQ